MMKQSNTQLRKLALVRQRAYNVLFQRINLDTFVSAISLFSKYAGFGSYEIESDGRDHTVVLHHELGRKWSIYVAYLMSEGLKSQLGISPRFQIAENSVIFEFFIPQLLDLSKILRRRLLLSYSHYYIYISSMLLSSSIPSINCLQ